MPDLQPIAVTFDSYIHLPAAKQLAATLQLPLIEDSSDALLYRHILILTDEYLGIIDTQLKKSKPFYIDFSSGKIHHRAKNAGRRNEMLAKSIGIKPGDKPFIVDATAGLGRDSFILASIGYNVTMLEKSPIVHALLADALQRAAQCSSTASTIQRMTLIHTDAVEWLGSQACLQKPDVVYIDPMFPARQKSASVKKDMLLLQTLLYHDDDNDALFKQAIACTVKRVVVKRPRLAANIADHTPTYSVTGNSSRFDIYVV